MLDQMFHEPSEESSVTLS